VLTVTNGMERPLLYSGERPVSARKEPKNAENALGARKGGAGIMPADASAMQPGDVKWEMSHNGRLSNGMASQVKGIVLTHLATAERRQCNACVCGERSCSAESSLTQPGCL
jgi:hypothetical protein